MRGHEIGNVIHDEMQRWPWPSDRLRADGRERRENLPGPPGYGGDHDRVLARKAMRVQHKRKQQREIQKIADQLDQIERQIAQEAEAYRAMHESMTASPPTPSWWDQFRRKP